MANTNILIKRSIGSSAPGSLKAGELAYSYNSNTAFIGSPTGDGVVKIGGQRYTDIIDAASESAVNGTLVKRDSTGNVYANYIIGNVIGTIEGSSNSAVYLSNPRNFSLSGGDITAANVSFNGSADVTLNASLNDIAGLTAGSVGSSTSIPVITYGANGRILGVSSESISTSFNLYGDSGVTAVGGGDSLEIVGVNGIVTSAGAGPSLEITTDDTVLRSNTSLGGNQTQIIDSNIQVNGNLYITGTTVTTDTTTLNVADPLIYLASDNYSADLVDIGFAGNYYDGSHQRHTGVYRHAGNKKFYVFDNYEPEPDYNVIDPTHNSFRVANLVANITSSRVFGLTQAIDVADGGTGVTAFNTGRILVGDGTNGLKELANTNTAGTYGSASLIPVITTDEYGRVSSVSNTSVAISTSAITSGTLGVARGGTGATTFTEGQILVGDGTNGLKQIANVSSFDTSIASNYTVNNLTVDTYGRVTSYSTQQISGLTVAQGGTGASSFSAGRLVVGDGTGALQSLSNTVFVATGSGASNNTVSSVTVDAYGRVTAATYSAISGLTVAQGGTGLSTITTNGITFGNGTGNLGVTAAAGTSDQTWSNQILTVNNAGVPVWSSALDGGTF